MTTAAGAPLPAGLRVPELSSGPAGGVATMNLGDFRADVRQDEPPGGGGTRSPTT